MDYPINLTFTLGGLFKVLYSVIGIVILSYVFLILRHLHLILKSYSGLLNENVENFNSLIESSAQLLNRVNTLTEKVPETALSLASEFKDRFSLIQKALSLLFNVSKKRNNDN